MSCLRAAGTKGDWDSKVIYTKLLCHGVAAGYTGQVDIRRLDDAGLALRCPNYCFDKPVCVESV